MCDAYGRGVVRGQVEKTNLRAFSKDHDVTSAEAVRTFLTECFFGREYVQTVEKLDDPQNQERRAVFAEVDVRNQKHKKVAVRDVAHFIRPETQERRGLVSFPLRICV